MEESGLILDREPIQIVWNRVNTFCVGDYAQYIFILK